MFTFLFFLESTLLGLGLAMDAFSVSLANGMNEPRMRTGRMCGMTDSQTPLCAEEKSL